MCEALVQISIDQFLKTRASIHNVSSQLKEKGATLKNGYRCFSEQANTHSSASSTGHPNAAHGKGRFRYKDKQNVYGKGDVVMRTDVVKIGSRELSRENMAKKDFLALMNKLTDLNKAGIYQSIKNVFREDCIPLYVSLLWDIMQRSSDFLDLYMGANDALVVASNTVLTWQYEWGRVWKSFLELRAWTPPAHTLQDDNDYDEFCDFVKWKKRTLGAIKGLVSLSNKGWIQDDAADVLTKEILGSIDSEMLVNPHGSKSMDAHLEQLQLLVAATSSTKRDTIDHIAAWSQKWESDSMRPSSRFKMLDINDMCASKLKVYATIS